jgi:hypothetical protein
MSRTTLQAADRDLLAQAYENHCKRCPTCRGAEDCDTGAAILNAIATTDSGSDLPGYLEGV